MFLQEKNDSKKKNSLKNNYEKYRGKLQTSLFVDFGCGKDTVLFYARNLKLGTSDSDHEPGYIKVVIQILINSGCFPALVIKYLP